MRRVLKSRFFFLVPLAVLGLMLVATARPGGGAAAPLELAGWFAVAILGSLHRPLGAAGLGLGAATVPLVAVRFGILPAVLVAGVAALAAAALRGLAERRRGATEHRGLRDAGAVAGAALAGAVTGWLLGFGTVGGSFPARAFLPAAVYATVYALLARLLGRRPTALGAAAYLLPLSFDAVAWVLGAWLADAAAFLGWQRVLTVCLALSLLAAEAARQAFLRDVSEHRIGNLVRLQEAHERILAEISGMAAIAQQILIECANVLPVQWFQFELLAGNLPGEQLRLEPQSWSAGPDGVLVEGSPRPPPRPRTLPGVHRRVSWRVLEAPLEAEGEVLARMRLWCDPRRIEPGSEDLLSTLVPLMASSLHRARLDREARLDPLTGVPVRRILESRMQSAYRQCRDAGRSMAVVMCDIDHFKHVNDTYGHAAGDEALILVAQTLDQKRREGDLCCRYGGEEFTLLLEGTSGDEALRLAERLRQAVEALDLHVEGTAIPLTLSAGVAAFPELYVKTASELLLLADEALYGAKDAGRNRTLLNLGRGRFRDIGGAVVTRREAPAIEPPRIFG